MTRFILAMILAALSWAVSATAQPVTDQTRLVAKAVATVERLRAERNLAPDLSSALARARAVMVVPDLVKGGFILGAEYGTGVLLTRDGDGRWSGPAFYSIASGSVGLQAGVQDAEVMYVIMTQGGLTAVMDNRFKAGADVGVAVATAGAGAEAATTTNLNADIVAFSKAVGLYGGASLEGAGILPRDSWNAAYYDGNPSPADILIRRVVDNPQADRLRDVLAR
ncbi:MAG: lipid-binding SYLF domain-containing protein [Pseudomonadota bacterium]